MKMISNSKMEVAEFEHFERISNPEDIKLLQEFIANPHLEENKHQISNFFAKMNVEINADELAKAIHKFSPLSY